MCKLCQGTGSLREWTHSWTQICKNLLSSNRWCASTLWKQFLRTSIASASSAISSGGGLQLSYYAWWSLRSRNMTWSWVWIWLRDMWRMTAKLRWRRRFIWRQRLVFSRWQSSWSIQIRRTTSCSSSTSWCPYVMRSKPRITRKGQKALSSKAIGTGISRLSCCLQLRTMSSMLRSYTLPNGLRRPVP